MDKNVLLTLGKLENVIAKIASAMLTKSDAKNFATKDDIKAFATKDDIKGLATKDDVLKSAEKVTDDIAEVLTDLGVSIDEHKVEKTEFFELKERVTKLERKSAATKSYD